MAKNSFVAEVTFKACGNSISFPLKLILKSMINEGVFPEDWKKRHVAPTHRKELKNLIMNYRPVFSQYLAQSFETSFTRSLTSFSKINYSLPVSMASYLVTHVFLNYYESRMKFTKALPSTH